MISNRTWPLHPPTTTNGTTVHTAFHELQRRVDLTLLVRLLCKLDIIGTHERDEATRRIMPI